MLPSFRPLVSLAAYTTFHIGGAGEYVAEAETNEEVVGCVGEARAANLPLTIIGGGSNTLIADEGIAGCVLMIRTKGISVEVSGDQVLLTAAAGEVFDEVVAHSVAARYWGLENLSHIPGSVGATPVQNIGAYGVEIGTLISSVLAINIKTQEEREFSPAECQFGYRTSYFKTKEGSDWLIMSVTYCLSLLPTPLLSYADLKTRFGNDNFSALQDIRNAIISIRSQKFPDWNEVGTAGSFFKNPVVTNQHYQKLLVKYPGLPGFPVDANTTKIPLGWVLDKVCGLRGYEEGHVSCYGGQALVVVAQRGATSKEVENFVEKITALVYEKVEINIEWEVTKL